MHSLVLVDTVGCALFGLFQAAVGPADRGWCKVPFPEQGSLIQLDFGGPRLKLWSHRSTESTRKPSFSTRTTLFKSRAFRLFGFSSRSSVFSLPPTSPCGEARMAAFCGGGGAGGSGAWPGRVWCWHRRGGAGQVRSARGRWCRGGGGRAWWPGWRAGCLVVRWFGVFGCVRVRVWGVLVFGSGVIKPAELALLTAL